MKLSRSVFFSCFLFLSFSALAQHSSRDLIKVGGGYNLVTLEDVFVPMAYIEYTRVFYPPVTIGISANYSKADNIERTLENRSLETFSFDLLAYYSLMEESAHGIKLGFMMTARSFVTDWENTGTGLKGTERKFHPGLGFILNYDVRFNDVFLMGVKASLGQYNNKSSVFLVGLHAGVMF